MIDDDLLDEDGELKEGPVLPLLEDEDGDVGILPEEDGESEIPEGMHEVDAEDAV